MDLGPLPRIITVILCVIGVGMCFWVGRVNFRKVDPDRKIHVGIATLSSMAFFKLLAFASLFAVPAGAMVFANYQTFEGVHAVESCERCHVMRPMATDMRDPESTTLAARHFRNGWIPKDQCYQCHSDYGLAGDIAAKMEGYRHLARYTTSTYEEPIKFKGRFHNDNCLKCHSGTQKFESVQSHQTVRARLEESSLSCLNCHGRAHPTRAARTPGSDDYDRLMGEDE